jgi:hypothetical protein
VGSHLGLPYYGTKSAPEMFPLAPNPVAGKQSPHLTQQPEETQEMSDNEQLPEAKPTLEELVARITDENRHPETDRGEPVGEEVW